MSDACLESIPERDRKTKDYDFPTNAPDLDFSVVLGKIRALIASALLLEPIKKMSARCALRYVHGYAASNGFHSTGLHH